MNYVIYYKNSLKVRKIYDIEPASITDDYGLARCEEIPEGDNFSVTNLQNKTETYKVKEQRLVVKTDEDGNKYEDVVFVDVEKTREYQTCELVAKVYTEEELALKKHEQYKELCQTLIRQKYSQSDEDQVKREYLEDLTSVEGKAKFDEYNAYVKACLARAKEIIYNS